jgi:Bacterial regulatory proteins, luxR family
MELGSIVQDCGRIGTCQPACSWGYEVRSSRRLKTRHRLLLLQLIVHWRTATCHLTSIQPSPPHVHTDHLFGRSALDHHSSRVLVDVANFGSSAQKHPNLGLIRNNPFRVAFLPIEFSPPLQTDYFEQIAEYVGAEPLSTREIEVLRIIATGCSNKIVADRLEISEETVKFHIKWWWASGRRRKIGLPAEDVAWRLARRTTMRLCPVPGFARALGDRPKSFHPEYIRTFLEMPFPNYWSLAVDCPKFCASDELV